MLTSILVLVTSLGLAAYLGREAVRGVMSGRVRTRISHVYRATAPGQFWFVVAIFVSTTVFFLCISGYLLVDMTHSN